MKQRLTFTFLMALVTTGTISFALILLNYRFKPGFLMVWLRSWLVSYPLAVLIILFIGPWVQGVAGRLNIKLNIQQKHDLK